MAMTPAVGPKPTTRTKISAQISSGTLRSTTINQRRSVRNMVGSLSIFPVNADTDKTLTESNASGIASTNAITMPAVAMATVRQVSLATSSKNSPSILGGKKSLKNFKVGFKLLASKSVQTLNSVSTSMGHSSTPTASSQKTRADQAGSRLMLFDVKTCINGNASQPARVARQAYCLALLQGHPAHASVVRTRHANDLW